MFGAFAVFASAANADPTAAELLAAKTPTSKAYVDAQVGAKQQKIGAGTAGSVITYSGTAGTVGSHAVYNSGGAYNTQSTALIEAGQANTAIQNGLNAHMTCAESSADGCLLWQINSVSGTYVPHG